MTGVVIAALLSCASTSEPSATPEAPSPLPLAELLYGGELAHDAQASGDRVRVLLWLRQLQLPADRLEALRAAAVETQATVRRVEEHRRRLGQEEFEALEPLYTQLAHRLSQGPLTKAEAEAWTQQHAEATSDLPSPSEARTTWVRQIITQASSWRATLDEQERIGMAQSLFFLRRLVAADVTPTLYEDLLAQPWQAGDFASLRRSRSSNQTHMDLGALFTLQGGEWDLLTSMDGLALDVVIALALTHPQLLPCIDLLRGESLASVSPLETVPGAP